jgi:phage shock protein PspC (stress-responsive transcriptional regulator)
MADMNALRSDLENPGQAQPQAATLERVPDLSDSLRDTAVGGAGEPARVDAMKFSYPSGSRPLEGYTIKRGVGRGGFGEVYYATSDAGKEVALKLIRRNLEIELRGVSQCLNLKHPHLVSLYDIRQDANEDRWVIMEYVAGESLDAIIERHPNGLPAHEAVGCFRQVAAGVAYLHDQGIVHRDLKPGNIFLDETSYKIGDYGLSKFISASRRSGQTESIGTVHYMAPEIANGRYGKEIDIYALGIILYEMLTGRVPYEGESLGEVLMKHLTAEPDLSIVPEAYRHVVSRMLCKNPEQRYHSISEALSDLEAGPQPAVATVSHGGMSPGMAGARKPLAAKTARQTSSSLPLLKTERLMLASDDAVLGGVCGGFARYLGVDPVWVRLGVVAASFATGFVPVLVPYFILMCVMPSDVEEVEQTSVMFDSARAAIRSGRFKLRVAAAFRLLLSLLFGVGFGLLAGGAAQFAFGTNNSEEIAVALGIATGCMAAATMATILGAHRQTLLSKTIVSLLLAAGFGVSVAAGMMVAGVRHEEICVLCGLGTGFLAAGMLITLRLYTSEAILWRFFPPLFLGAGAGMLTGGGIELTGGPSEVSALIGAGVGILVFGMAAAMLFLGMFSPTRAEAIRRSKAAQTQVWDSNQADRGAKAEPNGETGRTKTILVSLAILLGIIPAALFVFKSQAADSGRPLIVHSRNAFHKCDDPNCGQASTVLFSSKGIYDSVSRERRLCNAHARMAAWDAVKSDKEFHAVDLATASTRTDLLDVEQLPAHVANEKHR